MADHTIKLAGEHLEHSDSNIEIPTSDNCMLNHFGRKALEEYGVSEDMAALFTTSDSLQALNFKVPPETACKFNNRFQTSALTLLGKANADLALSFDNEMLSDALVKALDLKLAPTVALQVTNDLSNAFKALSKDSTVTQVLKLDMPLKDAFKFDKKYKVQAWEKIKPTCLNEAERPACIANAGLIDSHTKLEALNAGVPAHLARKFIHPTQVDAWNDIIANDQISLSPEKAAEYALQIDTSTKLVALQAGVHPETAGSFINQFQTDAWTKKIKSLEGYKAEDALKIDTEIKLSALLAGVTPEDAASFTEDIQVRAWELISLELIDPKRSVEFALATTKEIQIEALKAKVPPSDAVEFVNDVQIAIWKKMAGKKTLDVLKIVRAAAEFKTIHQANVLLAGAELATAKVALKSTHEEAYIKHGVSSPNILKGFDAQHKLRLLEAGIDKEIASETGWAYAQYLLIKSDHKKYFGEKLHNVQDEIKAIYNSPAKLWEYATLKTAGVIVTSIGSVIALYNFLRCCCSYGPKTASTVKKRAKIDGGIELHDQL